MLAQKGQKALAFNAKFISEIIYVQKCFLMQMKLQKRNVILNVLIR